MQGMGLYIGKASYSRRYQTQAIGIGESPNSSVFALPAAARKNHVPLVRGTGWGREREGELPNLVCHIL